MEEKKAKLLNIDNIRLLMITLVVVMHLAVTYSGYGSWYYEEGRPHGFAAWGTLMVTGGATRGEMTALNGGFTWQSAAFSLWESFSAVAVDFGLLVLFRNRFNAQGAFVKGLSASAFAVYVFHTPLIVAIALLFRPVGMAPILKFAVVCVACLPPLFRVRLLRGPKNTVVVEGDVAGTAAAGLILNGEFFPGRERCVIQINYGR